MEVSVIDIILFIIYKQKCQFRLYMQYINNNANIGYLSSIQTAMPILVIYTQYINSNANISYIYNI